MSKLKASVTFGVPRRTLQHRLKKANFMQPYKASNTYLSDDDSADDIEQIELHNVIHGFTKPVQMLQETYILHVLPAYKHFVRFQNLRM